MPNWRSKSSALFLEVLNDKIEELKNVSYNFSEIVNQKDNSFGVKGKGSPTGAFGATSGNQIFNPTVQIISEFDEAGVATGTFDRLNISSRYMIVKTADPSDVNIKWIQLVTANGQPIFIQIEKGKTGHLQVGGNIDIGSQVDFADNQIVELVFSEESDITSEGGFVVVGLTSGGSGLGFPILYPEDDLGIVGASTVDINISGTDSHFKQVKITDDIGLSFSNPPVATVFFEFWVMIIQDGFGGHSIIATPPNLKNAGTLDSLLDKAIDSVTLFHFTTGDGGASYHGELVDLTTAGGAQEFFGPMTAAHDYAGQNITNFGTLFFDEVGTSIIVDGIGMLTTVPTGDVFDWTVGGATKMLVDTDSLDLSIDLDLNPTGALAHSISGFDFLQLQNDAGTSFGTVTPDQGSFPGWLLTMGADQDFIIAGSSGERFRFQPDNAPSFLMVGGLSQIHTMQTSGGDVYQILLDETGAAVTMSSTENLTITVGGNSRIRFEQNDIVMLDDVDLNTFDIFNADQIGFQSSAGTLSSANVGFGALGNGGFRANILDNGEFQWTEENILKMKLDDVGGTTTLELQGVLAAEIILTETTSGTVGSLVQGSTTLQHTTDGDQHEFLVGVESIAFINSDGIAMQGSNFITTPQIGFSILGNIIQDDINGMIFDTPPGDDFTWGDGTNIFAVLDIEGLFLNELFIQFTSIASPGVTGSSNVGELFMDSGNSDHLSIIRNGSVIDLEVGAGTPNIISQLDSSVTVTDTGSNGLINFVTDGVLQGSIRDSLGWTFNNNVILGTFTSELIQGIGSVARDWIPDNTSRSLGSTSLAWSVLYVQRTHYIIGGAISGRMLVDTDGVEIEALLTGDFIELKTQNTVRANFKAEADGGITFFEPFEINDEMRIDGGNMILANDSVQCGFAVTDEVTLPGNEGTMQMPRTTDITPDAASLDADFGSALGCYGILLLEGLPTNPVFVIKVETSPSTWRGLVMPPSGTVSGAEFT